MWYITHICSVVYTLSVWANFCRLYRGFLRNVIDITRKMDGMSGVWKIHNQFTHKTVFVAADVDGNASGGIGSYGV